MRYDTHTRVAACAPPWQHTVCYNTARLDGWKEISSMKRTTKKTLFVFVLIAAMMLSIFPAAAFAEGAAAGEPAAQTEQQPEKDAAPAAKDDGAKPAEPAKDDGAKPAEPAKDGETKAAPVNNDEKSVVVEVKDGEKPADPALKDGEERETSTYLDISGGKDLPAPDVAAILNYDANGGTGAPKSESKSDPKDSSATFTVSSITPTRDGYTFKGWNTDPSGNGTAYEAGKTISVAYGSTTTLYAQWEEKSDPGPNPPTDLLETKLIYNANAADAVNVDPAVVTKNVARGEKAQFIVTSDKPTRPGYTFSGWSIIPDAEVAYNPDSVVEVEAGAEMILYAVWVKNVKLEIIYDGNADGVQNVPGPDVEWVEPNGSFVFTIAEGPTRPGYRFVEWNTADNGTGDSIKPGQTTLLHAGETGYSKTYYAKWEPEEVTPVDWGKLGISKSVSPTGPVKPGTTLTYTITVTNNTGADLDSVVVYDKLDRHLTFVSATGAGSYSTRTCFWTVAPLANGDSATLVIQATVNAGTADKTVIYNTASVLAASSGNEALKVGSGPSASANVAVTNPGSGTWGGTTWGKGVQTGDDANLGLWIAAMIVSFLCVAALVYVNRKRIFKGKANNK